MNSNSNDSKMIFSLTVGDGTSEAVDHPTISVRWCANDSLIRHISNYKHPMGSKVLLRVLYQSECGAWIERDRAIADFADGMTYVDLSCPGKFIILSDILVSNRETGGIPTGHLKKRHHDGSLVDALAIHDSTLDACNDLHNRLVCTHMCSARYNLPFLTDHNVISIFDNLLRFDRSMYDTSGVIAVAEGTIDENLFAKYPKWVKTLANFGHAVPAENQCVLRRRLVLSILYKIWMVAGLLALYFAVGLLVALWYAIWLVPVNIKGLCNRDLLYTPVSEALGDPSLSKSPFFSYTKFERRFGFVTGARRPQSCTILFNPLSFILYSYLVLLASAQTVTIVLTSVAIVSCTAATIYAIWFGITKLTNFITTSEKAKRAQSAREKDRGAFVERASASVSCNNDPIDTIKPIHMLPMKRKPVRVILKEIQRYVCRPLSR